MTAGGMLSVDGQMLLAAAPRNGELCEAPERRPERRFMMRAWAWASKGLALLWPVSLVSICGVLSVLIIILSFP